MSAWQALLDHAIDFRHQLHRHPELPWQEDQTAASIRAQLDALEIPWRACATTGTLATLGAGASGPHIALRADIDALPIHEAVDVPWRSAQPGCMHACGHDGHSATLLATMLWLKQQEEHLPGPVTLVFQPAEEGGHGAREMIADGALDGIDEIYGWHNWPAIPYGEALCPDGPVMAGNGQFQIVVQGKGGHASQPEACRDPLLAAAAITLAMQQIVSRRLSPKHMAVVSVTSIDGKSGETVIPDAVTIGGSIRVTDINHRDQINQWITDIAGQTATSYGVAAETTVTPRYNPTVNNARCAARMRTALADEFGDQWHTSHVQAPIMASEDFSYYLEKIPGAFALIGMHDNDRFLEPCHSPRYQFNDALIERVARIFCRLVGAPLPD